MVWSLGAVPQSGEVRKATGWGWGAAVKQSAVAQGTHYSCGQPGEGADKWAGFELKRSFPWLLQQMNPNLMT